jgi:hypothetical protein
LLALNLTSNETVYEQIASLVGTECQSAGESAILGLVVGTTDAVALKKAPGAAGERYGSWHPAVRREELLRAAQTGLNAEAVCSSGRGVSVRQKILPQQPGTARKIKPYAVNKLYARLLLPQSKILPQLHRPVEAVSTRVLVSLAQGVLKFGSFVLKSGRTSPYFQCGSLCFRGSTVYTGATRRPYVIQRIVSHSLLDSIVRFCLILILACLL